jgi:hypothetical protein
MLTSENPSSSILDKMLKRPVRLRNFFSPVFELTLALYSHGYAWFFPTLRRVTGLPENGIAVYDNSV